MATYEVVEQEYKEKGETLTTKCKEVQFYPKINAKTQAVEGFGSLGFTVYKVVLKCLESGDEHNITWSRRQPDIFPHGKFNWHQPATMVHQTFKVGGGKTKNKPWDSRRLVEDTLSPMKRKPGMKIEHTNPDEFALWLVNKVGETVAEEVIDLFAAKIAEGVEKENKRAAKRAAAA